MLKRRVANIGYRFSPIVIGFGACPRVSSRMGTTSPTGCFRSFPPPRPVVLKASRANIPRVVIIFSRMSSPVQKDAPNTATIPPLICKPKQQIHTAAVVFHGSRTVPRRTGRGPPGRESFLTGFRVRPLASGFVLLGTMWSEHSAPADPRFATTNPRGLIPRRVDNGTHPNNAVPRPPRFKASNLQPFFSASKKTFLFLTAIDRDRSQEGSHGLGPG